MHDLLKAHQEEWDEKMSYEPEKTDDWAEVRKTDLHARDRALLKRVYEEERRRWIEIYDKRNMSTETNDFSAIVNTHTQNIASMEIDRLDDLIKQLN